MQVGAGEAVVFPGLFGRVVGEMLAQPALFVATGADEMLVLTMVART